MLIIFPHPDDESYNCAGIIMTAKELGYDVTLITLTQGGAGKISINPKGKSLKELRIDELKKAAEILGIDNLVIKDYDDAKLKKRNGWSKWLEKETVRINPGIVVTYDHTGLTGHPDHISISLFLKELAKLSKLKKTVFLWPIPSTKVIGFMPEKIRDIVPKADRVLGMPASVTYKKLRAVLAHKSQKNNIRKYLIILMLFERKEWYHKVVINKDYPYKFIDFEI